MADRCMHGLLPDVCAYCEGVATIALPLPNRRTDARRRPTARDCGEDGALLDSACVRSLQAEIERLAAENAMLAAPVLRDATEPPRSGRRQAKGELWARTHEDSPCGDVVTFWQIWRQATDYQTPDCGHLDTCGEANDRAWRRMNHKQRRSLRRAMLHKQSKHVA